MEKFTMITLKVADGLDVGRVAEELCIRLKDCDSAQKAEMAKTNIQPSPCPCGGTPLIRTEPYAYGEATSYHIFCSVCHRQITMGGAPNKTNDAGIEFPSIGFAVSAWNAAMRGEFTSEPIEKVREGYALEKAPIHMKLCEHEQAVNISPHDHGNSTIQDCLAVTPDVHTVNISPHDHGNSTPDSLPLAKRDAEKRDKETQIAEKADPIIEELAKSVIMSQTVINQQVSTSIHAKKQSSPAPCHCGGTPLIHPFPHHIDDAPTYSIICKECKAEPLFGEYWGQGNRYPAHVDFPTAESALTVWNAIMGAALGNG